MKYKVTKNAKVSGAGFYGELEKASQSDLKKLFSIGVKGIEKVEEEAKEDAKGVTTSYCGANVINSNDTLVSLRRRSTSSCE